MTESANAPAALELRGVCAGYGSAQVIHGLDLVVPRGGVVALLGANGAGKTTVLRLAAGLLPARRGVVELDGADVTRTKAERRAAAGLCLIPEGRGIFRSLSVRENLQLYVPPRGQRSAIDRALAAFPILGQRLNQIAGSLSGGQQQMLAFARAHIRQPRVVLLDEVSLGLSPVAVDEIFESLDALAATGAAVLIVEQYVQRALALAQSTYLLSRGRMRWSGPSAQVDSDLLAQSYLGDSRSSDAGSSEEESHATPPASTQPHSGR